MNRTEIRVLGSPEPLRRHRSVRNKQTGMLMHFDPAQNTTNKDTIRWAWREAGCPSYPQGEAILLDLYCYFPRPKGHFGTGRNAGQLKPSAPVHHVVRPDGDNLLKLVKDALNGLAWHDDSQIVTATVRKRYAPAGVEPHTAIAIETVAG